MVLGAATVLQAVTEAKKTDNWLKDAREATAECSEAEKTEYGREEERETSLECPVMKLSTGGCPYAYPSVVIAPLRPEGLGPPSPRLAELLEGAAIPGDCGHPPDPPAWLDRELFNEGRKFYQNYLSGLVFSELLFLILGLAHERVQKPLLYSGRSDSEAKARRRYMSTLLHVMSWFQGDVWDTSSPSHRDIISVRTTHRRLGKSFNRSEEYEKVLNVSVQARGHHQPPDSLMSALKEDLRAAGVKEWKKKVATPEEEKRKERDEAKMVPKLLKEEEEEKTKKKEDQEAFPLFISQLDMSMTQCSFMGLLLAHPTKLGAGGATRREMEGLVHFWRGLGWLLGIEDQYNFCSGSVEETRDLCLEIERDILLPGILAADWDYEHMVASLIGGMSQVLPMLSLPPVLLYMAHTMDIPAPALSRSLTWGQFFQYWNIRFNFWVIYYAPGWIQGLNAKLLDLVAKEKEKDKVNLAAYRKAQAALTVPES